MKFDKWFFRQKSESYIGIDTSAGLTSGLHEVFYNTAVEFRLNPRRGSVVDNYPVVSTDFRSGGEILVPMEWKDVPPKVKARFTRWMKLQ